MVRERRCAQRAVLAIVVGLLGAIGTIFRRKHGDAGSTPGDQNGRNDRKVFTLFLIAAIVAAFLLATVAKAFGGKTNTNEMLRVTGYVYAFNLVGLLVVFSFFSPALVCLTSPIAFIALILSLIGYVIGIREAAEFSTGNAVITALIVAVVSFVINLVGGLIANFF